MRLSLTNLHSNIIYKYIIVNRYWNQEKFFVCIDLGSISPFNGVLKLGCPRIGGSQEPSLIACTIINSSSSDLGTQLPWQYIIYHLYKQINTAWCVSIHISWDIITYLSRIWDVLIRYWIDLKNSSSCKKCMWAAWLGDIAGKKVWKTGLICKSIQRGYSVEKYKDGLYKFNNFLGSPSLSHDNNFTSQLP